MVYSTAEGETRVELFARSSLPRAADRRREAVATRLDRLAERGCIEGYHIEAWRKRVPVAGDTPEHRAYERFREWADDAEVSLAPSFGTRECYDPETGAKEEALVLPALCLAIYEEEELVAVYPHADGGEPQSVVGGLSALADRARAGDHQPAPTAGD